jgi:CRISPR-associated exonuclease Cas4
MLAAAHADDDLDVPISAIEHYSYCPRQCALIHVEQTFDENLFTIRGHLAHERIDSGDSEVRHDVRVARGIPLWSERLGLRGKADLVEFRPDGPYPVEYKLGRRVSTHAELQLCAQALCLEEMLEAPVSRGAIFYHAVRRRHEVILDEPLRTRTLTAIRAIRQMLMEQTVPPAVNDARCPNCSLINACLPWVVGESARLRGMQGALFQPLAAPRPDDAEYTDDEDGADGEMQLPR